MKRNPQRPHWGWTVTTGILQHSTTAPNHFPWPLKRRIRKPGFALSSQEEGIKVKYQWPGIEKGLAHSFIVTFSLGWSFLEHWLFRAFLTFMSTSLEVAFCQRLTFDWIILGLQKIYLMLCWPFTSNWIHSVKPKEIIAIILSRISEQ